ETFNEYIENYSTLPKNSFDYEVVERAESIAVVSYAGTWKDLGTWNTLCEEMKEWVQGRVVTSNVENVHVINETGLPMVVSGLKDAVVVCTHDGVLACTKEASTGIKKQVESISESRPMYEKRRWGEYRVIDSSVYDGGRNALTKELIIASGKQLSYQRHAHRSEVWTIVKGTGEVVLDGHVTPIVPGTVLNIRPMQMHAVRAMDNLHIIEVQLGTPLIEEDIERFGNYWKD
ncbi:MAG: AraC family ligand binding domain-containing protein, partial [Bacteroides sp.]